MSGRGGRGGAKSGPTSGPKSTGALAKANAQTGKAANNSQPLASISNRYQKPGGPKGFGGPLAVDVLTPTLPPLYPTAPKPLPLDPEVLDHVKIYIGICQYINTNFGVRRTQKSKSAFNVDRYTDKYNDPEAVDPDIVHRVGDDWFPTELTKPVKSSGHKRVRVAKVVLKKQKKIDDLGEDDDKDKEEEDDDDEAEIGKHVKKKVKPIDDKDDDDKEDEKETAATTNNEALEDEEMEDADEELDMDTDYASNYFDNGEDFLSDHEGDDGPVY